MKYFQVTFSLIPTGKPSDTNSALLQDARDLLMALAGEAGFETFEETGEGVTGYVQQSLFCQETLDMLLSDFPIAEIKVSYHVEEAEDRDWNATWEEEGFDPIVINRECIIHDGRHLGQWSTADFRYAIEIDARLAFGTGTHETTRMMIATLLQLDLKGKRVLDCGCGTGILSIAALKAGAAEAVGYDIDEWSADNAVHNAIINGVDDRFTSLLGDVQVTKELKGQFDLVLANINRNILLADMPSFVEKLTDDGVLQVSGFYSTDRELLTKKAESLGLHLTNELRENDWTCLRFQRNFSSSPIRST